MLNLAQPINWQNPLNRGLTSWYLALGSPYSTAGTVADVCKRNNGTYTNGARYTGTGVGGLGAFYFDGTDDNIQLATNFGIGGATSPFSVMAWARRDGSASNQQIIAFYDGSSLFQLGYDSTLGWRTAYGKPGFNSIPSSVMSDGSFAHIAFTLDSGGNTTLYVNGVSTGTSTTSTGAFTSATSMQIGRRGGDNAEPWPGLISSVRMYNARCLSGNEIKQIIAQERGGFSRLLNYNSTLELSAQPPAAGSFQPAWARGSNVLIRSMA